MKNSASLSAVARHLDVSQKWVRRLVEEKIIPRLPDGKFDLDAVRVAYIHHLREKRSSSGQAELIAARTRLTEMRTEVLKKKYLDQMWEMVIAHVMKREGQLIMDLEAIPAAFTRDLHERRRLTDMINQVRIKFAKALRAEMAEEDAA